MKSETTARRRPMRRIKLSILIGALAALALCATSASASTLYYHPLLGQFGPQGTASLAKFKSPVWIAADPGSHDVYVSDILKGKEYFVYRFDAAGEPKSFTEGTGAGTNVLSFGEQPVSGLAVAPPGSPAGTAGDLYVVAGGKVEVYSPGGAHLGTIDGSGNPNPGPTTALFVATGPDGALYIGYKEHLDKYVPSANPPKNSDFDSELRFEGFSEERKLQEAAVTANGIYVVQEPFHGALGRPLARYPLSAFPGGGGSAVPSPELSSSTLEVGLATDFSTGDFYVTHECFNLSCPGTDQYNEAGNWVSFIHVPGNVARVAVDSSSGKVYRIVTDSETEERDVRIYGKGEPVQTPTAAIDPVTEFKFNRAHLTGTVNPGASGPLQETVYRFVCKPECPGLEGERTVPGDGADHAVSDDAVELQPETKYEVTLIARNANWDETFKPAEVRSTTSFETPPKPPSIAPEAAIDPVTEFGPESAHLTGTVDPNGTGELQETTYRFEYSTDGKTWTSAGNQGPVEGGPQEVSTDLEGLEPNTAYEVRLHAENVGGEVTTAPPNPSFTTKAAAPEVEMTGATQVLTASAQLNGRIDPRNSQTSYWFEWGTGDCSANPCASLPLGKDGDAGSGHELEWVNQQLAGLEPGTEYSYRLVAENATGKSVSAAATFTTEAPAGPCANAEQRLGASAQLPDCRAYEMVSPQDKNGGNVATIPLHTRVAADGNAVTFESTAAFAGATGAPYDGVEYMALRGPEGWATHSISPFQASPPGASGSLFISSGADYVGSFSPDFGTGVFHATAPIAGATTANVTERFNLYLATGLRGSAPHYELLSDAETPLGPEQTDEEFLAYAGASADFHKVVFEDRANLVAPASGSEVKVYEAEGGTVRLASILPDSACGSPPCTAEKSYAGRGASAGLEGLGTHGSHTEAMHVVSADGSKVFFTDASSIGAKGTEAKVEAIGHIYARLNGTDTVQIDASERTVPQAGPAPTARFEGASADGRLVYFTTGEPLVDEPHGTNFYRYDFDNPSGQRLTAIPLPCAGQTEEVLGVSEAGDFVYGRCGIRLFVIHNGRAAVLTNKMSQTGDALERDEDFEDAGSFRMTPDGRYFSFATTAQLTGYDNANVENRCEFGSSCDEVYFFSYDSGELTCASCNFGQLPAGDAFYNGKFLGNEGYGDTGFYGLNDPSWRLPMSRDGRSLFFSTRDALVPQDSNGNYDAYVYDTETQKVSLLSSGQCNCKSRFVGTSPDGHDAFFTTYGPLVRADADNLADLYDARVEGGIPSQNAPPPAECQGDACQPVPGLVGEVTPTSEAFSGPGSPPPTRHEGKHRRHKHKHKKHHVHHRGNQQRAHAKQGGSK